MFCRVAEQVVTVSKPAVPAVLEQANPPAAAVAKAELVRLAIDPPTLRAVITLGVPPSAATITSTTVAA